VSATAFAPVASLRNDLAAFRRHLRARLRMTLRDPFALGLLAFAGIVTVPLWLFPMGIDPLTAYQLPWPSGGWLAFTGPPPTALQLAFRPPDTAVVLFQLLWSALVAGSLARESALRRWPVAPERELPALPVGPRARLIADVLAAIVLMLAARAVALSVGGLSLGAQLYGHSPSLAVYREVAGLRDVANLLLGTTAAIPPTLAYVSAFAVNTVLGALFSFPLVLAWRAVRLDGQGLLRIAIATLLLFGAAGVGAMAHVATAALVCAGVSAFLLVRPEDGGRSEVAEAAAGPLLFRPPIGSLRQLRRDFWRGPLELRGRFLAVAAVLALMPGLIWRLVPMLFFTRAEHRLLPYPPVRLAGLTALAVLTQWLVLLALAFFPFGLALLRSATPASRLFSGTFLRSWSTLPVPRAAVVRRVYAHALLAAALAWLVLGAQAGALGARFAPVSYELPVVFLVAGIVLCEAVGDRRRGLLAVWTFAAFQFGVPFTYALFGHEPSLESHGASLTAAGIIAVLVGGVPPLVHLRARARA
jgi:hypothetical protein